MKNVRLVIGKFWSVVWIFLGLCWLSESSANPNLTLANTYRVSVNLEHYWVSEKYDGVRGYWDGQQFLSRQGYVIEAPDFFKQQLPAVPLDGELWLKRESFAYLLSIVRRETSHPEYAQGWQQVRYMVFDAPAAEGGFQQRYAYLQQVLANAGTQVQLVEQQPVKNHQQLLKQLDEISSQGAEGLMLRHVQAPYRGGRSDDLLKLKLWDDAEARVLAHLPGKGKFSGMMGSVLVRMEPDGPVFKIGSGFKHIEREQPPEVGSVITFRYQGLTHKGLPRFPVYWRPRAQEF